MRRVGAERIKKWKAAAACLAAAALLLAEGGACVTALAAPGSGGSAGTEGTVVAGTAETAEIAGGNSGMSGNAGIAAGAVGAGENSGAAGNAGIVAGAVGAGGSSGSAAAGTAEAEEAAGGQAAAEERETVEIRSTEDFLDFASRCTSESYSKNRIFLLEESIDLSGAHNTMIPIFAGEFRGNGHTISGVVIDGSGSGQGLFRYVEKGAVVEQLTVKGEVCPGGSAVNVGGIAGSNSGTLRYCRFQGIVSGQEAVGGIAGENTADGLIENCRNEAEMIGYLKTGGIAGLNEGAVVNCLNRGNVNAVDLEGQGLLNQSLSGAAESQGTAASNPAASGAGSQGATAPTAAGSSTGSQGTALSTAAGSSTGSQGTAAPTAAGSSAGSQGAAAPTAAASGTGSQGTAAPTAAGTSAGSQEAAPSNSAGSSTESQNASSPNLPARVLEVSSALGDNGLREVLEQEKINDAGGIAGLSSGSILSCVNYGTVGYEHTGYNLGGIAGRQNGQISSCRNYAPIRGRKDTGGIVGQMEPYLSVTYGEDMIRQLEDQMDSLDQLEKSMSRLLEDSTDTISAEIDQVGSRVDAIRDLERFYKDLLRSDKDDFGNDIDSHMDEIDRQMSDLDLNLISGSSKEKLARLKELEIKEETLRQQLNAEYTGDLTDTEALRQWLENRRQVLQEMEATAEEMAELTRELSMNMPEYAINHAEDFEQQLEELAWDVGALADSIRSSADVIDGDIQSLDEEMTVQADGLSGDIDNLSGSVDDIRARFRAQKRQLEDQIDELRGVLQDGADRLEEGVDKETLFDDISDQISIIDMDDPGSGIIVSCKNEGTVTADHQAGGIAGMIGEEISADPEEDPDAETERTLNVSRQAVALIRSCVNKGDIQVRYDCAGGIAGKANLGALTDNENYGDAEAGRDYAGGIAGNSGNILRGNYSMSSVAAQNYAGGIAGLGHEIYDSCAMPAVLKTSDAGECFGSIAGNVDEDAEVTGNCYVESGAETGRLGAVDGVTRDSQARELSYEELLEQKTVPPDFYTLKVTFLVDDQIEKIISCRYGDGIAPEDIPSIPEKAGFYGQWEEADLSSVRFSRKVRAVYYPWEAAVASSDDKMPELLAVGDFYPQTVLNVTKSGSGNGNTAGSLVFPKSYRPAAFYDYEVSAPDGASAPESVVLHVLDEEGHGRDAVGIVENGSVRLANSRRSGDYLIFDAAGQGQFVLLKQSTRIPWWAWGILALAFAAAVAAALVGKRKRRR